MLKLALKYTTSSWGTSVIRSVDICSSTSSGGRSVKPTANPTNGGASHSTPMTLTKIEMQLYKEEDDISCLS